MNKIFLGKAWHWAVIIIAAGLLWYCGSQRMHVVGFNMFIIAMLIGTAIAVAMVVALHTPGEQVTRDALSDHREDGGD